MDESAKLQQFELQNVLGVGKYGKVTRAWDTVRKLTVALKEVKIENEDEGIPITTLREIVLLKGIKHPNVVELIDTIVDTENSKIYLVLEFMDSDLALFIKEAQGVNKLMQKVRLPEDHVRNACRLGLYPQLQDFA